MENKTLIFGASGFIGSYIAANIPNSIPLSRKQVDVRDFPAVKDLIKSEKPDVIINCSSNTNASLKPFDFVAYRENLSIFDTFFRAKGLVDTIINFGSGAEFDRENSIDNAKEEDIFKKVPKDHYGASKNLISRRIYELDNFYNLRIFGCFHHTEKNRLLKVVLSNDDMMIQDRLFDYFWLEDVLTVVNFYLSEKNNKPKDLNLVYKDKISIKEFIEEFLKIKGIHRNIEFQKVGKNYTGSSEKIDKLNLNLKGLTQGLMEYKI